MIGNIVPIPSKGLVELFEQKTQIYTHTFSKSDLQNGTHNTTYHFYRVTDNPTIFNQLLASKLVLVELNRVTSNGLKYSGISEIVYVPDVTYNNEFIGIAVFSSTIMAPYGNLGFTLDSATYNEQLYMDVGETFLEASGVSYQVNIYKLE